MTIMMSAIAEVRHAEALALYAQTAEAELRY